MEEWSTHTIRGFLIHVLAPLTCFDFPDITLGQYCEQGYFEASCSDGETVVIEQAIYGRMHTGRCVKYDIHIGCHSDVITQLDKFCSGRSFCSVLIADLLQEIRNPCPADVRGFLEASYVCVPGNKVYHLPLQTNKSPFKMVVKRSFIRMKFVLKEMEIIILLRIPA